MAWGVRVATGRRPSPLLLLALGCALLCATGATIAGASKCVDDSPLCHDGVYELDVRTCNENFGKGKRFGITYMEMWHRAPKALQAEMAVPEWPAAARLAFVVKAHSADTLYSAERLIRWLYHPSYKFAVHFDRKGVSGELGCYFTLKYSHLPNVVMVPQIHAAWGHYGNSKAELLGYRMLHHMGGWDYAINLSGSTLPLIPPQALSCWVKARLLDRNAVPAVIPTQVTPCCVPYNPSAKVNLQRTTATCLDQQCTQMAGTPDNQPWWKGSEWKILSFKFVEYLMTDPLAKRWLAFFRAQEGHTLNEAWAQTIAKHSPFRYRIIYDDTTAGGPLDRELVFTQWHGRNCSLPNPRPTASPCFLTGPDMPAIRASTALFARKFFFSNSAQHLIKRDLVFPSHRSPLVDRYCGDAANYPPSAYHPSTTL